MKWLGRMRERRRPRAARHPAIALRKGPADIGRPVKTLRLGEFSIVGLGAVCDKADTQNPDGSQSFRVGEFALLDSGDRLMLHCDRGWTTSGIIGGSETLSAAIGLSPTELIKDALNVLWLDSWDAATGADDELIHWQWLAQLAEVRGIDVTPEELRDLPYEVLLTDGVLCWIEQHN